MPQASRSPKSTSPNLVQQYASLQDSLTTLVPLEWSLSDLSFMNICDNKWQPDSHLSSPFNGSLLTGGSDNFAPLLGEQDIQDSIPFYHLCEWDQMPQVAHDSDSYLGALLGGTLPTPQSGDSFPLSSYAPECTNSTESQVLYCPCYATTPYTNGYTSWISGIPAWSGQYIDQFVISPHAMAESYAPINFTPPFITNEGYNSLITQYKAEARVETETQKPSPISSSFPMSCDLPQSSVVPSRTCTGTKRNKRSVANNKAVQHTLCLWDNCNELITTDKRSVGKHLRGHLRALGLLPITSDYITTEPCRVHCLWRDDVACPYSDRYQSEALARLNSRKTRQYDRSTTRDQQLQSNKGDNVGVEFSSDCDGAMLSVHSLINHICAKHLFSLAATCSDCGEQFTRTDAHLRHRREVHIGRQRRR